MPFDFSAPIDNLPNAELLASMIECLDQDDWRNYLRQNSQDVPQALGSWQTRDSTDQAPRAIKIEFNAGTLILIQGVKRERTAFGLMNAYGERPRQADPAGLNEQVYRAVQDMYGPLVVGGIDTRQSVLIAGHSYGGACAVALGCAIKTARPSSDVRVVTFGAPKPGNQRFGQDNQTLQCIRFWNDDDPIPLLAPNRSQAPAAHSMLPRGSSTYWHDQTQVGNGVMLSANGDVLRAYSGPNVGVSTEITLIGWATGILTRPVQAHSIHEYYLRLVRANARNISIGTDRPGTVYRARRSNTPEPQPMPADVPSVAAAIVGVQTAIAAERSLPLPTTFVADQRNGQWGVFRGTELVTFAATRTRARSIARTGNSILRDMQARGEPDEESLRRVLAKMLE